VKQVRLKIRTDRAVVAPAAVDRTADDRAADDRARDDYASSSTSFSGRTSQRSIVSMST
jgi:hypothetical protein